MPHTDDVATSSRKLESVVQKEKPLGIAIFGPEV